MNIFHFLYVVFLFVLLTPAILLRLPPKGNKWLVALVHGVVFATVLFLTNHLVSSQGIIEGLPKYSDSSSNYVGDLSSNLAQPTMKPDETKM
jgi:hypothetical protein